MINVILKFIVRLVRTFFISHSKSLTYLLTVTSYELVLFSFIDLVVFLLFKNRTRLKCLDFANRFLSIGQNLFKTIKLCGSNLPSNNLHSQFYNLQYQ